MKDRFNRKAQRLAAKAGQRTLSRDPAQLTTLRRQFASELKRGYAALGGKIVDLLVRQDALGLKDRKATTAPASTVVNAGQWSYETNSRKVERFRAWLRDQMDSTLAGDALIEKYIEQGHTKGVSRAHADTTRGRAGKSSDGASPVDELGNLVPLGGTDRTSYLGGAKAEFVRRTTRHPVTVDQVKLLAGRTFAELDGVNQVMASRMSRLLADGLVRGKTNAEIATDLVRETKIAGARAAIIVRTELARAHAEGQLNAMSALGVKSVGAAVEWTTSDAPCAMCEPLDGVILSVEEARGLLPRHVNCFLTARIPIYTADGWKPIGKVAVGDLVLTHVGRFRQVVETHRNTGDGELVVEFRVCIGGPNRKISVTGDHPIMVNKLWKPAKDIKPGQKARWLAASCQGCGKTILYGMKYCDQKCQWKNAEHRNAMSEFISGRNLRNYASGKWDGKKMTEAAHERVREMLANGEFTHLGAKSGEDNVAKRPEVRKKLSEGKMGDKNPMRVHKEIGRANGQKLAQFLRDNPEKHANSIMAKAGHRTGIEKKMEEALANAGIAFEFNFYNSGKWIDFALLDYMIAVECDGAYWHQDREADKDKNQVLAEAGWTVLRFTDKEINRDVGACLKKIVRVMNNHDGNYWFSDFEIVEVVHRRSSKVTLHNLSVEEDESYLAKGCVVHNCLCSWQAVTGPGEDSTVDAKGVRGAMKASRRAEGLPLGGKGVKDGWGGGVKVSKDRPVGNSQGSFLEKVVGYDRVLRGEVANSFCPMGEGGGVDPSCAPKRSGLKLPMSKGQIEAARARRDARADTPIPETVKLPEVLYVAMPAEAADKVLAGEHDLGKKGALGHGENRTDSVYLATVKGVTDHYAGMYEGAKVLAVRTSDLDRTKMYYDAFDPPNEDGHPPFGDANPGYVAYRGKLPKHAVSVVTRNSFCPTGEGGGVDPSCSPAASRLLAHVVANPQGVHQGKATDDLKMKRKDVKAASAELVAAGKVKDVGGTLFPVKAKAATTTTDKRGPSDDGTAARRAGTASIHEPQGGGPVREPVGLGRGGLEADAGGGAAGAYTRGGGAAAAGAPGGEGGAVIRSPTPSPSRPPTPTAMHQGSPAAATPSTSATTPSPPRKSAADVARIWGSLPGAQHNQVSIADLHERLGHADLKDTHDLVNRMRREGKLFAEQIEGGRGSHARELAHAIHEHDQHLGYVGVRDEHRATFNTFCPTGEGGGVDPSCSPGGEVGEYSKSVQDMMTKAREEAVAARHGDHGKAWEEVAGYFPKLATPVFSTTSAAIQVMEDGFNPGKESRFGGAAGGNVGSVSMSSNLDWATKGGGSAFGRYTFVMDEKDLLRHGSIEDHQDPSVLDYEFERRFTGSSIPPSEIRGLVVSKHMGRMEKEEAADWPFPVVYKDNLKGWTLVEKRAKNTFCPTGAGGGVDPSCSPSAPSSKDDKSKYVGQKVGAAEQEVAAGTPVRIADALGGKVESETKDAGQRDKKPYDVQVPKRASRGKVDEAAGFHDLEVKTLVNGSKQSISVHDDALLRKVEHAERNPANTFHTVVRDARAEYAGGKFKGSYSGHDLYYKRGSGRYALSKMYKVKDEAELGRLLNTKDDDLPEKARGRLPSGELELKKLRAGAAKAKVSRDARNKDRKERNKEKLREQARARRAKAREAKQAASSV